MNRLFLLPEPKFEARLANMAPVIFRSVTKIPIVWLFKGKLLVWAVLSYSAVYYDVQGGSNVWVAWTKSWTMTIQMKAIEQYVLV